MAGLQGWHIIVIVAVIVLMFGAKRLPDMARGVGKSLRIFKSETKAMRDEGEEATDKNSTETQDAGQLPPATPSANTNTTQQQSGEAKPSAEAK